MNSSYRVIQSTGKWYKVSGPDGQVIESRLPGIFRLNKKEVTNPVAVGDYVELEIGEDGTGSITEIKVRENYVPRQATHGRRGEQILVANIDKAWVVQSVRQPKINAGFIDRFLVTCEAYEVRAGIIFNKTDLAKNNDLSLIQEFTDLYEQLGYDVLTTSIEDITSVKKLSEQLSGKTSVFIGPSGVGKTSLLNAVEPGLGLKVGDISARTNKGKHTTTYAQLVPLQNGGFIVDTPGIREFGVVNIPKSELSLFFPEMREPREHCKFYNCTHFHEPGCGVSDAYEQGEIDADRYSSYLNILESLD